MSLFLLIGELDVSFVGLQRLSSLRVCVAIVLRREWVGCAASTGIRGRVRCELAAMGGVGSRPFSRTVVFSQGRQNGVVTGQYEGEDGRACVMFFPPSLVRHSTRSVFFVLNCTREGKRGMTVRQISDALGIDSQAVSAELDYLCRARYVGRRKAVFYGKV